jgi:hypothetical protein
MDVWAARGSKRNAGMSALPSGEDAWVLSGVHSGTMQMYVKCVIHGML